jgi:hypothetical protein
MAALKAWGLAWPDYLLLVFYVNRKRREDLSL